MAFWNRRTRNLPTGRGGQVVRASAVRKNLDPADARVKRVARKEGWQDEAFDNFDELGIIKAPVWWSGNAMSKLKLYAAVRPIDDPEGAPIPVADTESGIPSNLASYAQAEIERLKSPFGGRAEILRMLQMNLEIAGLGWLVCIGATSSMQPDPLNPGGQLEILTPERWDIRSIREVEERGEGRQAQTIVHDRPGDTGYTLKPDQDEAIAIFQRNPGWSALADCHMRGVLTDCNSLVLLQNEVQAESKSRQSNGILLMPNGLRQGPTIVTQDDGGAEATVDPAVEDLSDALIAPIEDPSAAESVVPLVIFGERDDLKEVRHISLARDTTAVLEARIEARKVGIAEGLNLPPEVVRGHMGTTYANASQIDQDTYDDYLGPRVNLICDGFTTGFLQPHLLDAGFPPELVERIIVAGDPYDMIDTADPAEFADEGINLNTISAEAWRRLKGFSEDDAPEPLEQLLRAFFHIRTFDPGLVDAIVKDVIPELKIPTPAGESAPVDSGLKIAASAEIASGLQLLLAAAQAQGAKQIAARASGALAKRAPGHALAAIDRDLRTKVLTAANAAMNRALERAGTRLKVKDKAHHEALRTVNPIYAAQFLGPAQVQAAGFTDDGLIGDDAFDGTVAQFDTWTAHAQEKALGIAAGMVTLTGSRREVLRQQQSDARKQAGVWLRDALLTLAATRLYAPDELPTQGEFEPSMKIPAGLVREALAIAGGAQGIEQKNGTFVVEVNGQPPGEIGNGQLIRDTLTDGGAKIQANVWDYGPDLRKNPFEPHEDLDGLVFESFGSDDLATDGAADWVGINGASFYPGDHDGCCCQFVIAWVTPDELTGDTGADLAE